MAARRGIFISPAQKYKLIGIETKKIHTGFIDCVRFYIDISHLIIDNECFVVVVTRYISNPVGSIPQEKPEKKI